MCEPVNHMAEMWQTNKGRAEGEQMRTTQSYNCFALQAYVAGAQQVFCTLSMRTTSWGRLAV